MFYDGLSDRNARILRDALNISIKQSRPNPYRFGFLNWFQMWFEPHLWYIKSQDPEKSIYFPHLSMKAWSDGQLKREYGYCLIHQPEDYYKRHPERSQQGGGEIMNLKRIYQYNVNGVRYRTKIVHLIATDTNDEFVGHIYLMSPIEHNTTHRCVHVMISKNDPHVADLSDVNTRYTCSDEYVHDWVQGDPPQAGGVYVRLMLRFLERHARELDIQTVELTDNAFYQCVENCVFRIHLEQSRQLEGEYPYYVQFGFMPKYLSAYQKLVHNRTVIGKLMTRDYPRLLILCHAHFTREQVRYVRRNQGQLLSDTLRYLSRVDCKSYSYIYQNVFEDLHLSQLEENEMIYVYRI